MSTNGATPSTPDWKAGREASGEVEDAAGAAVAAAAAAAAAASGGGEPSKLRTPPNAPPSSSSSSPTASAPSFDPPPAAPPSLHNLEKLALASEEGDVAAASALPFSLGSIRIQGVTRMRPEFLGGVCLPYVDKSTGSSRWASWLYGHRPFFSSREGTPDSVPSLLALAQAIGSDLTRFDVFSEVTARLEPSRNPRATEEDVDVVLDCREKSRLFLKSSTDVGNGEGSAVIQGRLRNLFGGAEALEGSATFGTRTKQAFNLAFSSPVLSSPDHTLMLTAFGYDRDCTSFASCYESSRGGKAALLSNFATGSQHELSYDAAYRHLGRLLPSVSISIRKMAQPTVKTSVAHTYITDTRDDPFMATSGRYGKLKSEFASEALGGDQNFIKVEGEAQTSRCFGSPGTWAYSLSCRAGLLRTLDGRPSSFSDRFQLGGPTCVRMYRVHSLGPKDRVDSLGGDALWSAGASLMAPIPYRPAWPLKLHAFVNAGQLVQLDQQQQWYASPAQMLSQLSPLLQPSSSAGIGLLFRQGQLRVELNAGLPLTARKGDGLRKGLQLGIGISFL